MIWLQRQKHVNQGIQACVQFKAVQDLVRIVRASGNKSWLTSDSIIVSTRVVLFIAEETDFPHRSCLRLCRNLHLVLVLCAILARGKTLIERGSLARHF